MVPGAGIEPAQHCCRGILSPLCLPIPPPGHRMLAYAKRSCDLEDGGVTRSRTGLDGFAIHCITALLSRLPVSLSHFKLVTFKMERKRRLELPTPTLARLCSTN
jgi:hypothetical protein